MSYQKTKVGGEGNIFGNKVRFNYTGSNKCPDGYYWVNGYNKKVGLSKKVYVAGHCRKVGTVEIEDRA